jgi:hypothetical protein
MRMLGSTRYQLDYRPTVLGHGLWIIEAKAPTGIDPDEHLAQAWTYATHPEVNVPLFVLADGRRIAVHDSSSPEWNVPVVDMLASEMVERFPELIEVLAPRKVALSARERLIRHLENVLRAELDYSAIDETLQQVRLAGERARPAITANRELVADKAEAARQAMDQRVLVSARLWGLAQERNIPFGWSLEDVTRAIRAMEMDTSNVDRELDRMIDAVRLPDGSDRAFWGLRTFRVAVATRAKDLFGSSSDRPWLRSAIRDNLLGFPDDPTSAAAHQLELPLFVLAVRIVTQPTQTARAEIQGWLARLDPEARLGLGQLATEHSFALEAALLLCRRIWAGLQPWTAETLHHANGEIRELLQRTPYDRSFVGQYVGHAFADDWEDTDPLVDYTIIALADADMRPKLTPEEQGVVSARAHGPGRAAECASKLIRAARPR